jgi:hypothetical protein
MGKAEKGSKLLAAIGKTKKEQMARLYPKSKPKEYPRIKSKGPYTRGKVMGKGDVDKFLSRRSTLGGVKDLTRKAEKEAAKAAVKGVATVLGAGVTGYGIGKGWHKKVAEAVTKPKRKRTSHQDKALKMTKEAIKKQKKKKEKHHSR